MSRLAVVSALLAAWASVAEAAQGKPPVFGSDVSIVSVPVFVVDRQGQAVRGLRAEDFEVSDDKKRVPIVSFQYVDTTSPETQEQIREAPAARRRFLLLFDMSFTDPGGLHRARKAAREMLLRRLAPSDLAAVATFDTARGLRMVANFTEDKALLVHSVETLGVSQLARVQDPLALFAGIEITDIAPAGFSDAESDVINASVLSDSILAVLARQMRAADEVHYRAQVVGLLRNLEAMGKALRSVEGRKQVLYFSAGFDSQAVTGNFGSQMRQDSEAIATGRMFEVDTDTRYGDPRLRGVLREVTRALAGADCVVHTVDVTGLGSDRSLTQDSVTQDPIRDTRGRDSLHLIAAETGGRLFKDTNDLGTALDELLEMTSRFYILGYQPEDLKGPGTHHRLKVKVKRRAVKVSHRPGFYERLPLAAQTPLQRQFESAQLVMTGVGPNDLRFSALAFPLPAPGERQTLGLVVQVPMSELPKRDPASLEIYGYAVSEDGVVFDHLAQLARIDRDKADPEGRFKGISLYWALQIPPGRYTLRLMVQERESDTAGVQFIDVVVPPYDARAGMLLPPVLVDWPDQWLSLGMGSKASERTRYPFTLDGQRFLPRTSFEVLGGTPETLVLIAYHPDRPGNPAEGTEIHTWLTDGDGRAVPPGRARMERVLREDGGRRTYVLGYTPDAIEPGDYTLRIRIGEAGRRLESYVRLRVALREAAGARRLPE